MAMKVPGNEFQATVVFGSIAVQSREDRAP